MQDTRKKRNTPDYRHPETDSQLVTTRVNTFKVSEMASLPSLFFADASFTITHFGRSVCNALNMRPTSSKKECKMKGDVCTHGWDKKM